MPLLYGKPFTRVKPPSGLSRSTQVYHNVSTTEVFEDYREFCDRVFLCHSVIWVCAVTGRGGLTFDEACENEEKVLKLLDECPVALRVPILYLASKTDTKEFRIMVKEVFNYIEPRYFIGEVVQVSVEDDVWCDSRVIKVSETEDSEVDSSEGNRSVGDSVYRSPYAYQYEVQQVTPESDDTSEPFFVGPHLMKRKDGDLTQAKVWDLLAVYAEMPPGGKWDIRDSVLQGYGINVISFDHIFCGSEPKFSSTADVIVSIPQQSKKVKRQENIEKYLVSQNKEAESLRKMSPTNKSPNKEKQGQALLSSPKKQSVSKKLSKKYQTLSSKLKERRNNQLLKDKVSPTKKNEGFNGKGKQNKLETKRAMALQEKHRQLELKREEKARQKDKDKQLAVFMKEWQRIREDLECEDLKELPIPREIKCKIPNEFLGDSLSILEFLHSFAEGLSMKDYFPAGVTFELLERALTVEEIAGPLTDILQVLITTVFKLQVEEDEEVEHNAVVTPLTDVEKPLHGTMDTAVALATAAKCYSQLYHGVPLKELYLDAVTITEIIRLHLLSSGGRSGDVSAKWRYQQRGGYTNHDDPGLLLCVEEPDLLNALRVKSIGELPLPDKLKIINCLISQILTYAAFRDIIDERGDKIRQTKTELRAYQQAEIKRKREIAAARLKDKKEAKLKGEQLLVEGGCETPNVEPSHAVSAKEEKELLRKKQEAEKKARELFTTSMSYQVLPLGMDRAYRRFWMFSSLPGLYVEHDSTLTGTCLPKPTPYNPSLFSGGDTLSYIRRLFEEETNAGSDKENDERDVDLARPSKHSLEVLSGDRLVTDASTSSGASDVMVEMTRDEFGKTLLCTANDSCKVHSSGSGKTKWYFYHKVEDVLELLDALNARGVREGELRDVLFQEKESVIDSVRRCPALKLDPTIVDAPVVVEPRKSTRNNPVYKEGETNYGFPIGTLLSEILEQTVRGNIVDTEEQIFNGGLGALKVQDRDIWRQYLINRDYSRQCDELVWGGKAKMKQRKEAISSSNNDEQEREQDNEFVATNHSALASSRGKSIKENAVVRDLSSAILQVAQCIPRKYLRKPLGSDANKDDKEIATQMEWWEVSLMQCTSYSQLYLHITTLANSIQWSRSALKAYCRICKRGRDADKMLLCDDCNKGHHMYCLKPKLTSIPHGDWFCPTCRPEKSIQSRKKARHLFADEVDSEHSEVETSLKTTCTVCGLDGKLYFCQNCHEGSHIECIKPSLKTRPKGKWWCHKCQRSMKRKGKADVNVSRSILDDSQNMSVDEDETGSCKGVVSRRSARFSQEIDMNLPLNNAVLQDLLRALINHKDGWPFLRRVSRSMVPDYHQVVKRPMDFGTMKCKLNTAVYKTNEEFLADALLVFKNCEMYNYSHSEEYEAGARLNRYFQKRCREVGLLTKDEEVQAKKFKPSRSSF